MVALRPFPYGAICSLAIGLRCRMGQCLIVRTPCNGNPRRVIVKFGCAFEMCNREDQNFGWFIEVLRIYLSIMDGPLKLFDSCKFWVYFSRVIVGESMVMNYHRYTPFVHICVF